MTQSSSTPAAPEVAQRVFHVKLPVVERYADALATEGTVRGLIGPREVPRLWERHLLNCGVMAPLLPQAGTVADIGTGAGLPGLVLAICRPDVSFTLVEPLLRRTTFLAEVVADLGLENVEIIRGKADLLHGKRTFDVVTSRAVASLGTLLEWSMPLVAPKGVLLAMKGASAAEEVRDASDSLAALGCAVPVVSTVGADLLDSPTTLVEVSWADPSRVSWRSASRSSNGASEASKRPKRRRERTDS
jgi:16S rRNA (guanine527-N7)-methyltransferase